MGKIVGAYLKKQRLKKGLTTRKLAERASVSYGYITKLEQGKSSPTLDVADRLLKALDADWIEFLNEAGFIKPRTTIYRAEEKSTLKVAEKTKPYGRRSK